MAQPVSLRELAKACGLGVSTVSHALRNSGTVSRETCRRVQEKARELGYVPNPLVASFASSRFRAVRSSAGTPAVFLTHRPADDAKVPWGFPRAMRRAAELGYRLRHVNVAQEKGSLADVLDGLFHQGVLGIVVGEWHEDNPQWQGNWDRFAVVCVSGYRQRTPFHSIRNAVFQHVVTAWEKLWERGYRRIGPAINRHPLQLPDDDQRLAAVLLCQQLASNECEVIPPLLADHGDRERFHEWFEAYQPDAVLSFSVMHYFRLWKDTQLRCPIDYGYATLHNHPGQLSYKGMAGVVDNTDAVCIASVEILDQLVRHHQFGIPDAARDILIPSRWIDGPTLTPKFALRAERERAARELHATVQEVISRENPPLPAIPRPNVHRKRLT